MARLYADPTESSSRSERGVSRRDLALGAFGLAAAGSAAYGAARLVETSIAKLSVNPFDGLVVAGMQGLIGRNGWETPGLDMAALKGRPVLVHAFASWCPVCQSEYEFFRSIASDPRFVLAGLIVMDKAPPAKKFLAERGNPHAVLGFDRDGKAGRQLRIGGVPHSYLVGRDGALLHTVPGSLSSGYFAERLEPLIDRASRAA